MKQKLGLLVSCLAVLAAPACLAAKGDTVAEKRLYVKEMRDNALDEIFASHPDAEEKLNGAHGYAVFSNIGSKILMVATGSGYGIAVNNETGEETYMKVIEAGGGIGIGAKKVRVIMLFHTKSAFDDFIVGGWDFGGDANADAAVDGEGIDAGGQLSIQGDVEIYELTDTGLALMATAAGTKFYLDDELN